MRLTGSSEPGAVERDRSSWLLHERAVLATAVCRELVASTEDDFIDRRARAALDLLRRWVRERYEADVETHPSDGLHSMIVPEGDRELMTELEAATDVCEAFAMLHTADTQYELRGDAARVRDRLRRWEQTLRELGGAQESGQDSEQDSDDEWPPYAVHAPLRTFVVRPGGEVRHRGEFPLPGVRVHVLAASTSTTALLGAGPQRFGELLEAVGDASLSVWSAFDPGEPAHESVVVGGLTDDRALEIGREFGQSSVVCWDEHAWTELFCDGAEPTTYGWSIERFDWDDHSGDAVTLRRLTPPRMVQEWTVSGVPGGWTVVHRGGGAGAQRRRDEAPTLMEALSRDPELRSLPRRTISEYAVCGDVDPALLALTLRVDATEGLEDPGDWPDDVAARWHHRDEPRHGLPWIDRWATIDGHRVSVVWAGGETLVVPRDAPIAELQEVVDALRDGRDIDYPWPSA